MGTLTGSLWWNEGGPRIIGTNLRAGIDLTPREGFPHAGGVGQSTATDGHHAQRATSEPPASHSGARRVHLYGREGQGWVANCPTRCAIRARLVPDYGDPCDHTMDVSIMSQHVAIVESMPPGRSPQPNPND
jgi:hypothetical protein